MIKLQMQDLKQLLLDTQYFIDNNFLDSYVDLICNNYKPKDFPGCELHHIIQKKYYKLSNIPVNNSKNNIVNLLYKDHCLAHWLLYNCTINNLKRANGFAFRQMVNRFDTSIFINQEQQNIIKSLDKLQKYYDATLINLNEQELTSYYKNHSLISTANHFNVSTATILKFINKYGLNKRDKQKRLYKISDEQLNEICMFYYDYGHSREETRIKFNIKDSLLTKILKDRGKLKKNEYRKNLNSINDINKEEFIEYYKDHSREETMIYFNTHPFVIQQLVKECNLTKRLDDNTKHKIFLYSNNHSKKETLWEFKISSTMYYKIIGEYNENNNKKPT